MRIHIFYIGLTLSEVQVPRVTDPQSRDWLIQGKSAVLADVKSSVVSNYKRLPTTTKEGEIKKEGGGE